MKLKFHQIKGNRIKNRKFIDVQVRTHDLNAWWLVFTDDKGEWVYGEDERSLWNEEGRLKSHYCGKRIAHLSSSSSRVKSVRAFRRRLKKWRAQLPSGTKLLLCSRFVGYDVEGKIC